MIAEDSDNNENMEDLGDDVEMTPNELYAELLIRDELIITVASHLVEEIKASIISVKSKENAKLKDKAMPVDKSKLSVIELPVAEGQQEGFSRVHIQLLKRRSFAIAKIESPSGF